jgi:hypothetical protein
MMSRLQSGFRSNHRDLLLASEEKLISILVLLDFSKAFDSVNHQLLCSKLSCQYKISTSPVDLIRSYLCIRDPACRIWCRIGPSAFFIIHQRYHERFCIMAISPVCIRRTILHQLTSFRLCWLYQKTQPRPWPYIAVVIARRPWWLCIDFYN